MEIRYYFEHFEQGKFIDYEKASLTDDHDCALSFYNKEWAEKWLKPVQITEQEIEKLGFAAIFMDGLKSEFNKNGIDLYKEFVIVPYTIESVKHRELNPISVEFHDGTKINVAHMNGNIFTRLQHKYEFNRWVGYKTIVKIDGTPSAYWGMTKEEILEEKNRIKKLQDNL